MNSDARHCLLILNKIYDDVTCYVQSVSVKNKNKQNIWKNFLKMYLLIFSLRKISSKPCR